MDHRNHVMRGFLLWLTSCVLGKQMDRKQLQYDWLSLHQRVRFVRSLVVEDARAENDAIVWKSPLLFLWRRFRSIDCWRDRLAWLCFRS